MEETPTKIFSIEWGQNKGNFTFKESEVGPGSDIYPRKYVRDRKGAFYFLEPTPTVRLSKFSAQGAPLMTVDLRRLVRGLTNGDTVTPQELFLCPDDSVAALLRVYGASEDRDEMRLVYLGSDGSFIKEIFYRHFVFKSFELDTASFLDNEGYLWTLRDGGGCNIYAPSGELIRTLDVYGSFVDPEGRLYSISAPVKLYDRKGTVAATFHYDGTPTLKRIDGSTKSGYLFAWKRSERLRRGDVYEYSRVLTFFHLDFKGDKLLQVGILALPPNRRIRDLRHGVLERTELYENRLLSDEAGNIYFLGRSPSGCWMLRMPTDFK